MNSNAKKISNYLVLFPMLFLATFFFFNIKTTIAESGTFEFDGPFPITMSYSGLTPGECDNGIENPLLNIDASNTTDDSYRIVYAVFHNGVAGCEPAFDTYDLSGFSITGKTEFAAKESGHFDVTFDSSTYSCGRVQYDVGYLNTTTGEVTLFIGQVINYGVDCANPPPVTSVCTENASVVVTSPLPSVMTPGQTYNFTVKSTNTGNTKWYHGSYFELSNKSGNLTINPTYGHLPYAMDVNDYNSWTFSVVAPSVPGNYSLDFQMKHKAGADYIKSDGNTCAAPSVDTFFGNSVTLNSSVVAAPTYTLMTTLSGTGSGTVTGAGTYSSGVNATVTASPSEGSTFTGWGNNCSGTNLVTQIVMNSNKICVATFNLNTYTITAVSGANGSVTPAGVTTKNYGTSQVYTITPTTNYRVSDVVVDGVSVGAVNTYTFSNIKANHVIGASFDINQFTLTLNRAGTGSGTVTGAGTYNSGVTAVPSATANFGSIFTGWSGDCNATSGQVVMNSNKTCTANFNLVSAITASLSANPTAMTLPTNSTTITWTTTGNPTSCVAGGAWSGSKSVSGGSQVITGLTVGTHTFNILCSKTGTADTSSSVTVTVSPVAEVNYMLIINKVGTGTGVVDGAGTYLQNTIGRASATANIGSTFVGWGGDCDVNGQVLMNGNKTCIATFNLNTYTITATSGANGTTTPSGVTTKNYGTNQIYTITPSLHYHVADVIVDGVSVGAVNTYTFSNIKANHSISSTFAIDQFRLTLNKAGTGTGIVNGAGLYNWGTVVTPGVVANPGSVFTGWSGDCDVNGQVVMTEDRTCTANFNLISAIVVSLEATPDSMTLPTNSTTITWTTTGNPTSCVAGGAWSGSKSVSGGSQVITGLTVGTHTFNILCSKTGTADTSSSVTVTVANYLPPTVTLTANPTDIAYNASSTLNWVSTNSNSCVASGDWTGNRTLTGSEIVNNLTSNKLYTITCTGLGGVASSSAQVTVASMPIANLSILKTADKSTANVGDTVTYTLTLTNNGPDNATEVTVIDILNSGLNFISASSTSGTYSTSTGVWTIGNLKNASTTTLTLVTTIRSGLEGQTIPNTAIASSTQNDPTPGNNTSTINVVVNEIIIPTNHAPVITLVGLNPASVNLGEVYLDPGATALDQEDGDITDKIVATSTVNTAVVGSYTVIYNVSDSKGLAAVPVSRTVNVLDNTPDTKGRITFCMVIADNDNKIATSSYGLPSGTFSLGLATTTNIASSTIYTKNWNTNTFSPNRQFILNVSDADCVTYDNLDLGSYYYPELFVTGSSFATTTYNDQYTQPVNNIFDFFVYSPELFTATTTDDSNRNLNSDGHITLVEGYADKTLVLLVKSLPVVPDSSNLSITKTADKSTANVGDTVTYTLILTNNGPVNATGVVVTDILHSGLNFVSASSTSGTYATSTGIWTVGNLNNSATTTLTLVTKIKSGLEGQTIPNTATTTATQNDPTPGDNTSTVNVVVNSNPPCTVNCGGNPTSNLSITKTADKSTANVGDTITYTITLVNNGPDNATGVSVTDIFDSRLNFVSATSTLGSYATSTGIWTIGNLNNASSTTLTLVATVKDGNQGQRIPNTVTVTSTQTDPAPGDNTTTFNVDINNPNPPCTVNCGGGGGGGGGNGPITPNNLTIFNEQVVETVPGVAFVSWNTNLPATRRVVYGNTSNPVVGSAPNYGYTNSTEIVSSPLLTAHGMVVGVEANKTYYFREISTDILNGITRTAIGKELVLNPGNPNTSTSCYYLYDYLRKDFNNNPVEVRKLQVFLRDLEGFSTVQVTGVYDDQTIVALDAFQERYKGDILTPWGHTEPTSYTYILTKKKVNEIYCKMAFPVNTQQQQEIDSYKAFLLGLRSAGIILPVDVTVPPTNNSTTPVATSTLPLLNDIIGLGTSTKSENTTLAGVSTTTMSKFTANILSAWNKIGSWTGLSCEAGSGVSCSCRFINWILIIIIAIISYLWYRERQQNKNIEDINKEIDLNKEKEIDLELFK